MSIEFDDLGIDELMDDFDAGVVEQSTTVTGKQREIGGFKDMSEDDIEKFHQSDEYKEYAAEVTNAVDIKANRNGKTVQEILGLSNKREGVGYSHNAIECYPIDVETFQDIADQSQPMQETIAEGEELLPTFKYLYQDIFLSLYKYKARVLPETDIHVSARMNRNILKILINTPEYITLRKNCRFDPFNAALGTEIIGKEAIEILKEALEKVKELQKKKDKLDELLEEERKMDELAEEMENIDELLEDARRTGNAGAIGQLEGDMDNAEKSMAALKALANKIAEECDELVEEDELDDEIAQEVSTKMGKCMDEASEEVQEVSQLCNAWGLGEGDNSRVPYQQKKDAIEKIRHSSKLKQFTDAIGRFKESAITEQKKKAKHGAVEIKSVTVGDKIQDTLPSERMNLCMDATKGDFYRRMTEHSLMQYSKEAHKQKNKGPIIVCVDTSGSMSGDQEIWSKAVTVGLLEVAQLQKRDFACIIYSGSADKPIVIRKDEISPDKIIKCAETFHGGGTNFEHPLREAMKLIEDSTFKEADVVFITDGDCYVSDDFCRKFNRTKEEKEFRTLGVLVNMGRSHSSDSSLKEFCDTITLVSSMADLTDSESAVNTGIFGAL